MGSRRWVFSFTWEMLGWKVLCRVLVSTCSGTSPCVLRIWRARRSSGAPRCWCRILLASGMQSSIGVGRQNQEQCGQVDPSNLQHVIPNFVQTDRHLQYYTMSVWTCEGPNGYNKLLTVGPPLLSLIPTLQSANTRRQSTLERVSAVCIYFCSTGS